MKTVFRTLAFVALGAAVFATSGCKLVCQDNEEESGGECIAKSLTKFKGTPVTKTASFQPGGTVAVKGLFGHVKVVKGSTAGQIEVTFQPFDYEGYDEEELAVRQMNENLGLNIIEGAETVVQVERIGSSTSGLGCDVTVAIPDDFDGRLVLDNLGAGTFSSGSESAYDITAEYVAKAHTVSVNAEKKLSNCTVQGAATVTSTTVTCGDVIKVYGVSDNVDITSRDGSNFDDPVIELSVVSVSAGAKGGKITASNSGGINASFPTTGGYAVQAFAPKGAVSEGSLPTGCSVEEAASTSKTVTCNGGGAVYELTTNGENGNVFQEGNITLSYQ